MALEGRSVGRVIHVIIICLLVAAFGPAYAASAKETTGAGAATVIVNDEAALTIEPVIAGSRMYVPAARVAEQLGAKTRWDRTNEELVIHTAGNVKIVFGNGVPVVYIDGDRYRMEAEAPPFLKDGRLYVPLLQLSELLQADVTVNAGTDEIELLSVKTGNGAFETLKPAEAYSQADLLLLAKITMVEAGYETYEGQLALANVILNRVKDERFPDTIRGVIYSGKQFPPAHNGLLDKSKPHAAALRAAKDALNGRNNVEGAVYFYNPDVTKGAFWSGLEVVATIGHHRFAK